MAFVEWKESLSVQVEKFDQAHQKLIAMINRLHDAMSAGKGATVLKDLLLELREYTQVHFLEEETLMKEQDYPTYPDHKRLHDAFVAKIQEFEKKFNEGRVMVSLEIMGFLRDWLIHHIAEIDHQYSNFFQEKGIS